MLAVALLVVLPVSSAFSEPLIHNGDSVLFIGNSYTYYQGGLEVHLRDMFAAADEPLELTTAAVTSPGAELSELYDQTGAVDSIRNGAWDIVILQGGYLDPTSERTHDVFREYVRKFHDVIVEIGALPVIWAVWEPNGHGVETKMWQVIHDVTHEIADSLAMPVVPVGMVWGDIRATGQDGYWEPSETTMPYAEAEDFLYADWVHPTARSAHMNALIFYSFLTGQSCVGMDFTDVNGQYTDGELEDTVQARVWNVVKDQLWQDQTAIRCAWSVDGRRDLFSVASSAGRTMEIYGLDGAFIGKVAARARSHGPTVPKACSGAYVARSNPTRGIAPRVLSSVR